MDVNPETVIDVVMVAVSCKAAARVVSIATQNGNALKPELLENTIVQLVAPVEVAFPAKSVDPAVMFPVPHVPIVGVPASIKAPDILN